MKYSLLVATLLFTTSCFSQDMVAQVEKTPTEVKKSPDLSNLLESEKRTIAIYQNSVPAVVNVMNVKIANDFFYGRTEVPQGAGTGWIWSDEGYIVTNFHVVNGGNSFIITFNNDKKQYSAEVVGVSPNNDIAVLKLKERPEKISHLNVGSSGNLQVGQFAYAIGNPFGLDHSLSTGVISALGRQLDGIGGVKIHDMIQTDAAINQGNSGGPLLNSDGEVIGMNTMIFSTSGSSAGLGFAIPADTIKRIVPELIQHGRVIRPGLGIGILDDGIRERFFGEKGAAISYVDPDGAAAEAGLKGLTKDRYGRIFPGDLILKIDDKEVNGLNDVFHALDKYKIGDKISIEYLRGDKKQKTKVTLKELGS